MRCKEKCSRKLPNCGNSKTDTAGLSYFKISEPGEYRMVEQSGPLGYDTLAGNYEFTVDKYGEIHYAGKNIEENAPEWTLTHQNHLKPFDLTVHKKPIIRRHLKERNSV